MSCSNRPADSVPSGFNPRGSKLALLNRRDRRSFIGTLDGLRHPHCCDARIGRRAGRYARRLSQQSGGSCRRRRAVGSCDEHETVSSAKQGRWGRSQQLSPGWAGNRHRAATWRSSRRHRGRVSERRLHACRVVGRGRPQSLRFRPRGLAWVEGAVPGRPSGLDNQVASSRGAEIAPLVLFSGAKAGAHPPFECAPADSTRESECFMAHPLRALKPRLR